MALPLALILSRLLRWITYADCACSDRPYLDRDHQPSCPHPLIRPKVSRDPHA